MERRVLLMGAYFYFTICLGEGSWSAVATTFSSNDIVQITSDEALVSELQSHGVGYNEFMEPTLGKIGKVRFVDPNDGDVSVAVCERAWTYSVGAITKLASAGVSTPELSTDCSSVRTTLNITQMRSGSDVKLECRVVDVDIAYNVIWVKNGVQISKVRQEVKTVSTLQIDYVNPADAGWYTCEVMYQDKIVATGAVEVVVDEEGTTAGTTTSNYVDSSVTPDMEEEFEVGDVVQVLSDESRVRDLHSQRVGFTEEMLKTLGKIGKVKSIDSDMDLNVEVCRDTWFYHRKAVTKLASSGRDAPKTSSDCAYSNAIVSIKQKRTGNMVDLDCTVVNIPSGSIMRWVNKHGQISDENTLYTCNRRLRVHSTDTSKTFTLQIEDMEALDEGWYTCEVMTEDRVAATGAIQLESSEFPTVFEATTEASVTEDKFEAGDLVWVLNDKERAKQLAIGHGGWINEMSKTLGKIGRISTVYPENDLSVEVCNTLWTYNPEAVIKIASVGEEIPEISTNCVESTATVDIILEKLGNVAQLICSVLGETRTSSHIDWVKREVRMSRDASLWVESSRMRIHSNRTSATLEITNMLSEDAGWYTCELRDSDDKVAGARAVELNIQRHELPTCIPKHQTPHNRSTVTRF